MAAVLPEKEHQARGPAYPSRPDSRSAPHLPNDFEHLNSFMYPWGWYLPHLWHQANERDGVIMLIRKQHTSAGCYRSQTKAQ